MYLCFGTYATILKSCSLKGTTDKKIVINLIKAIDPDSEYDQSDNASSISRLINCKANFHTAASGERKGARRNGNTLTQAFDIVKRINPNDIAPTIHNSIIPLLDEDKKELLVLILKDIIKKNGCPQNNEKKLKKYTGYLVKEFCDCDKFDLANLLSGILIYTIIIGDNNSEEGRETLKYIKNAEYIENILREKRTITLTDNYAIKYPESYDNGQSMNFLDSSKRYRWSEIGKELNYVLSDEFPAVYKSAKRDNILEFISNAFETFNLESVSKGANENIIAGLLSASLRSAYYDEVLNSTDRARSDDYNTKIQNLLNQYSIPLTAESLILMSHAENLDVLLSNANHIFYRTAICNEAKTAVSFCVLAIFFTDLYLILTKYASQYADMIRYKTNADISRNLCNLDQHVFFQVQPFQMDAGKHRIDICLTCNDANSHKAVALFVNEFERALGGFEDIFLHIGFQLYYIRAKIQALGQDKVGNYNFEAYTPTLMPLLSGGHLYSSHMVFIRELVQNSIDSIAVRRESEGERFLNDIEISMCLADDRRHLSVVKIEDYGMGMSSTEIERYLTSIGRSFYTAGDFKKMNLMYKPISSFGIGFLSCFLVSSNIDICTHSMADKNTFELSIPNIEGCFFIEESIKKFHVGTEIIMNMKPMYDGEEILLLDVLEYADKHFLDVGLDIRFSWDKLSLTIMYPIDSKGQRVSILNSDIAELAQQEKHIPPCPFSIVKGGVILDEAYDRSFSYDWWNRYMKKSLGNLKLQMPEKAFSDFTIHKHAIRKIGKSFFLFIPFEGDGNVPEKWFDTIESTYEYPYGIFITDLPNAGVKIRSKSNGIRSYSGILRILNAGILIDEGSIEPIFGQIMKIFTSENETAYNNVIINFPPGWVELNVAREKIIGLSNINVCREKLLQGIAKYTLKALKLFTENKQTISLVNIQEIVNFITVICSDLNDDVSGKGKKLLAKLRKEKFLLRLFMTKDSLCLKMCKDNNEDMDMKVWLCENRACLPMESVVQPAFITERFFRDLDRKSVV